MNICSSYGIPCPYALSESAPIPCIGNQTQCNTWRNRQCNTWINRLQELENQKDK